MNKIKWKYLIISLGISIGTGALSAFLTRDNMEQYQNMYQPPLSPPSWVFPLVWGILFFLMGLAAYLVYVSDAGETDKKSALLTYGVQLVLNFCWSIIYFRWNAFLLAFAWLLLLWYVIFLTIWKFYHIEKWAGYLLFPYLAWVTFAGYLNLFVALYYLK